GGCTIVDICLKTIRVVDGRTTESAYGMQVIRQDGSTSAAVSPQVPLTIGSKQRMVMCHDMIPSSKYYSGMHHTAYQAYQPQQYVCLAFCRELGNGGMNWKNL
ncbi:hypothetical protein XENOCAPTIV_011962, partial [Xenoophorus captivus]